MKLLVGGKNWLGGERMGRPIFSPGKEWAGPFFPRGKNWLGGNSGLLHRVETKLATPGSAVRHSSAVRHVTLPTVLRLKKHAKLPSVWRRIKYLFKRIYIQPRLIIKILRHIGHVNTPCWPVFFFWRIWKGIPNMLGWLDIHINGRQLFNIRFLLCLSTLFTERICSNKRQIYFGN